MISNAVKLELALGALCGRCFHPLNLRSRRPRAICKGATSALIQLPFRRNCGLSDSWGITIEKDVDGFHPDKVGGPGAATPEYDGISLESRNVAVIGTSKNGGKTHGFDVMALT